MSDLNPDITDEMLDASARAFAAEPSAGDQRLHRRRSRSRPFGGGELSADAETFATALLAAAREGSRLATETLSPHPFP